MMDIKTYEECWDMIERVLDDSCGVFNDQTIATVLDKVLAKANVKVEPEPVLPGVTPGDWYKWRVASDASRCWRVKSHGNHDVAWSIRNEADAKFIAKAKPVVEAAVELIREWEVTNDSRRECVAALRAAVEEAGGKI